MNHNPWKPLFNKKESGFDNEKKSQIDGKKIISDDVKKLKSLKVNLDLSEEERINYYKEPIKIEYYIPKESRFAHETRFLYIKLIDVGIDTNKKYITEECFRKNEFVDLIEIMSDFMEHVGVISESYFSKLSTLEKISDNIRLYYKSKDPFYLKMPLFLTESQLKFEPTLASLEVLGSFLIHNLNWLIRKLNEGKIDFALEDSTIALLIKRKKVYWEECNLGPDEDFDLLSALFFEQAFPNLGFEKYEISDFFYH